MRLDNRVLGNSKLFYHYYYYYHHHFASTMNGE